jgi:hypothetical protein
MKIPEEFGRWGARSNRMLKTKNRGFAYLVLASYARPRNPGQDITDWCDTVLRSADLPDLTRMREAVLAEMDLLKHERTLHGKYSQQLFSQLSTGRRIFESLGPTMPFGSVFSDGASIVFPPTVLSDLSMLFIGEKSSFGTPVETEEWINAAIDVQRQFEDFTSACGY